MKLLELPEIGNTLVFRKGRHIAFVDVRPYECAENPLHDCGGLGDIISLSRRHSSYDAERFSHYYKDKDCVVLSYFAHGDCIWSPAGKLPSGANCPWDSVDVAGLWLPDKYLTRDVLSPLGKIGGKRRRAKAEELAAIACKVFTQWCNGHVYEYAVIVYKARFSTYGDLMDALRDYRHDEPVVDESCCGFHLCDKQDEEYLLGEINQHLEDIK